MLWNVSFSSLISTFFQKYLHIALHVPISHGSSRDQCSKVEKFVQNLIFGIWISPTVQFVFVYVFVFVFVFVFVQNLIFGIWISPTVQFIFVYVFVFVFVQNLIFGIWNSPAVQFTQSPTTTGVHCPKQGWMRRNSN